MQAEDIRALSEIRLEHAEECLETAKKIMALGGSRRRSEPVSLDLKWTLFSSKAA